MDAYNRGGAGDRVYAMKRVHYGKCSTAGALLSRNEIDNDEDLLRDAGRRAARRLNLCFLSNRRRYPRFVFFSFSVKRPPTTRFVYYYY